MRQLSWVRAIVTLWVLLLAGFASAGELRGRLLFGERPAAGVTVSALPFEAPLEQARREAWRLPLPPPLATVTTGADGTFVLTVSPDPGGKEKLFTVRVEGGGATPVSLDGVWDATESDDLDEHVLLPGGKLSGKVTDAAGKPVADAEVALSTQPDRVEQAELEAAPRFTKTAADGAFHFDDAGATGNDLAVEKTGLLAVQLRGVKAGALAKPLVLGSGVAVGGVVRKSDGKAPAAGALVRVEGGITTRWVEAGADGAFTVANARPGAATVIADAGEAAYVALSQIRLPLAAGKALTLVLQPPATLTGRAVDAKTSRPVPRAKIELRAAGLVRSARSGPDGTYALRGLPIYSWQVRADEARYVAWTHRNVTVRPGETKKLDIPLVLGATLSGQVIDEEGKPIGGAAGALTQATAPPLARIARRMRGAEPPAFRTLPDGSFKATRLAPGENQTLTVAHSAYEEATLGGVTLQPGATKAGVKIVLKRGAAVTGIVKDTDGQPVAGAEATLLQARGFRGGRGGAQAFANAGGPGAPDRKSDTTGGEGTFAIRGVAPGEYTLTVKRAGYATEQVDPVRVPEKGSAPTLEVKLTKGATISGRVVNKSGLGIEGFFVSASTPAGQRFGPAGRTMTDRTGPDGAFSIDGLKPGQSYDLQLLGPTGPAQSKRGVAAPTSDLQLTVAGNGRITGTAVDTVSGQPVTDFQVAYEPDRGGPGVMRIAIRGAAGGGAQAITVHADDGAFALEDVPAGTWSVVVTADGYQPAHTAGVVVDEGATHESVQVRLAKGTVLKGHVTDATTGAAVANATASLAAGATPPGPAALLAAVTGADVTTDASGQFEIDGVVPGKQTLHVMHPDYADATQAIDVKDDGASVEVRLIAGGAISGVVASDSGQPVPSATVTLSQEGSAGFGFLAGGGESSVTDGAGQFSFAHLGAGRYSLAASLGSHTSVPVEVVLQTGQSQPGVTLQLQLGVIIQGTVSGLPEGAVAGTTVTASGEDSYFQSTRVGADGRFEFDNVPVGIVTLRGTATDPTGATRSVTKQVTTTADQPVLAADLVFEQGYSLSGHVTQASQPVSGARVYANLQGGGGRQASAVADDGGAYQLSGLQDGTYTVNAFSPSLGASNRQTITLSSDQTLDIVFPSAKIAGQVVDANGKAPLANANVSITAQDTGATGGFAQRPATTDSNGQFSFSGLAEGSYSLATSKTDFQADTRTVNASDSGTDGLVIELTRAAGIPIKVMDGLTGVPLPGVNVRVLGAQGAAVLGLTPITLDGDGQGEIPGLPPGTYAVMAGASGYAAVRLDGVNVPSATVMIALTPGGTVLVQAGPKTLAVGTATGTITTAAGQPALLSLVNFQGAFAISEPNIQLRNVAPGSYVLTLPAVSVTQAFAVTTGGTTTVQLP